MQFKYHLIQLKHLSVVQDVFSLIISNSTNVPPWEWEIHVSGVIKQLNRHAERLIGSKLITIYPYNVKEVESLNSSKANVYWFLSMYAFETSKNGEAYND